RGPSGDVELAGDVQQMRLGGVGVDPTRGGPGGLAAATGGLPVARALAALGLPVVAHLLEGVLQRRVRGLVGAPPLAVRLDRGVVRLDPGLLRLPRRPLQGAGELLASRHDNLPTGRTVCTGVCVPAHRRVQTRCGRAADGYLQAMTRYGYTLLSEHAPPDQLVADA